MKGTSRYRLQKEAAKGNALGEDERASLEAALKAVSASAQTAAAEAGAWKVRAETAEEQVSEAPHQGSASWNKTRDPDMRPSITDLSKKVWKLTNHLAVQPSQGCVPRMRTHARDRLDQAGGTIFRWSSIGRLCPARYLPSHNPGMRLLSQT